MNRLNVLVLGGLLLLLSLSRAAVAAEYALPLELALEATRAAIAQCEAGGYRVTAAALASIPNILPLAGAPGGEKDEVCAAAGLAQIRSRLPG